VKELKRLSPHRPLVLKWRSQANRCATLFWGKSRMMNDKRRPLCDLSPDPDKSPADSNLLERLVTRAKATIQWPPDCLWPIMDHGWDT